MIKRYEVTRVKVGFGPGYVLQLDEKQAALRLHNLKKLKKDHYQILSHVEFKQGEIIGVVKGGIPKAFWDTLKEVDTGKQKKSVAKDGKESEQGGEEKPPVRDLSLKHRYFGKYDVLDVDGNALTEEPLPKAEAQAFLEKLQDEAE